MQKHYALILASLILLSDCYMTIFGFRTVASRKETDVFRVIIFPAELCFYLSQHSFVSILGCLACASNVPRDVI